MKVLQQIKKFAIEGRMAVVCDGKEMTYRELDNLSNAFATYILEDERWHKDPVIIYGNKDNLILALMMGALKSGRAYIPLDVTFPADRVKQVVKEVEAKIIINFTGEELDIHGAITKEEIEKKISKYINCEVEEDNWVKEDENAYILFTSGSTGKPKGVQISSNNIDSFTTWFEKYLNLDNIKDVMMNQVSYSFDVSVIPIYLGLINGKTLFSLSKSTLEDFKALFNALNTSKVKTWVSTPALADICIKDGSFNKELMPELDTFFFAGEVLSKKLIEELMDRFPEVRIINGYGPTEGTVLLSAIDITREMLLEDRSLPIGYPTEGGILKVIDENGNSLPEGEKGELVAMGASISKGYFNNEEMTKKVFFQADIDGRLVKGYKTGDMAYFEKGIIYYCGRKDFQIKLNGFRIELEDIENNLRRVSNISNGVVLPVYKNEKIAYLASFVTLKEDNGLSSLKNSVIIKNELKKYIPSYMIPRNIKVIKEFPININGKIDRKKLMGEIK